MPKVYVAGPYSGADVLTIQANIRAGIRMAAELLLAGFSPFCPWLDFQYGMALRDGEHISVENYQRYSIQWLDVSDAMLVLPGWEESKGTVAEVYRAKELDIPVFFNTEKLYEWRGL